MNPVSDSKGWQEPFNVKESRFQLDLSSCDAHTLAVSAATDGVLVRISPVNRCAIVGGDPLDRCLTTTPGWSGPINDLSEAEALCDKQEGCTSYAVFWWEKYETYVVNLFVGKTLQDCYQPFHKIWTRPYPELHNFYYQKGCGRQVPSPPLPPKETPTAA